MKLDDNLRLNQLVSCDACYAIFSPDNIAERENAPKHICPRCESDAKNKTNNKKELQRLMNNGSKKIHDDILIEVTRILDKRVGSVELKKHLSIT